MKLFWSGTNYDWIYGWECGKNCRCYNGMDDKYYNIILYNNKGEKSNEENK